MLKGALRNLVILKIETIILFHLECVFSCFFLLFERTSNHRIGSIIKAHITISLLVIGHSYIRLNIWKLSQEVITQKKKVMENYNYICYPHLTMNSHLFHGKVISINGTN